MASRGALTGGTGDVNPQWFFCADFDPGGTFATTSVPIPIQRLNGNRGSTAQVMEILKAELSSGAAVTFTQSAAADDTLDVYLTTRSFGSTEPNAADHDGNVISDWHIKTSSVGTAANVFGPNVIFPMTNDLTDGAGHGILIATDNIFVGVIQTGAAAPITGSLVVRVLYRWKNVPIQEYIGIVQSQR